MQDPKFPDKKEIQLRLIQIHEQLEPMIPKPPPDPELDVIELEISALMHEISFFNAMVEILYPLERAYDSLRQNPKNKQTPRTIEAFVQSMDFNLLKSFLTVTQFNLETLLGVIADEHKIEFSKDDRSLTQKYLKVMGFFDIEVGEYEDLLKVYHNVRNTLHSGTRLVKNFGPYRYKGETFEAKKGQDKISFANWRYFAYFTGEVLTIYQKILKSKKYKFQYS